MKLWGRCVAFLVALLQGCGGGGTATPQRLPTVAPVASPSAYWIPSATDTFQWQFTGLPVDTTSPASVYDLDAFDSAPSTVATLKAAGKHVVCYVDTGSLETWRPDAASFQAHPETIGTAVAGWPGEYWLDIRRTDILGPMFDARFDLCKSKGFDSIETDNVDAYANVTGFPLTANDQLTFNAWLATHVHARGLSIALKNDADQIPALEPAFDWAIEEECNVQGWCTKTAPFLRDAKRVVEIEYTDQTTAAAFTANDCAQTRQSGAFALLKHRALDAWALMCP